MGEKLQRKTCLDCGINPQAVLDFITEAEQNHLGINSFMLIKDGYVCAEGYHEPYNNRQKHVLYSLSKSITSTALGFAIEEGLVNLDDPITKFFPEYDKHGRNQKITVRHLVTMTAGKYVPMARSRQKKDWIKIFFDSPIVAQPGKKFAYINDNFYMLSALISKASGENLTDYLMPRLFEPLGLERPYWETDGFGYAAGGWGLYMNIEDLSKIMVCYQNDGRWNGRQIIPESWVREATRYQVPTHDKGQIDVTKGYGYGFWRTSLPDTYRAYGLHGQLGYVFRRQNTVLIVNSGISKDACLTAAINKMYLHLWAAPEGNQTALYKALETMGDKDIMPIRPRNTVLEKKYNSKILRTHSSSFASMLHATISTMLYEPVGKTDLFSLSVGKPNHTLYLLWKEQTYVNKIQLGTKNQYAKTTIRLGDLLLTACAKACWTDSLTLEVRIRIAETCHVRRLIFSFSQNGKIKKIKNDSFPDLPSLASYYMDFSGYPLPDKLEKLLIRYVAPGILLLGEPDFSV